MQTEMVMQNAGNNMPADGAPERKWIIMAGASRAVEKRFGGTRKIVLLVERLGLSAAGTGGGPGGGRWSIIEVGSFELCLVER